MKCLGSDSIKRLFTVVLAVAIVISIISFRYGSVGIEESRSGGKTGTAEVKTSDGEKAVSYKTVNCPELGFQVSVPEDMAVDKSYMPAFARISSSGMDIKISKEKSPYEDIDSYFNTYLYKYILDPEYRAANGIGLTINEYQSINNTKVKILEFSRKSDYYLHALFLTGGREFYCVFIRCSSIDQNRKVIEQVLKSFRKIEHSGELKFNLSLKPVLPDWNAETKAFYHSLQSSDSVKWGIFYPHSITRDFSKIEAMEKALDYKFPLTLHYIYLGHEFPAAGMRNAYERGKTVELTMQVMWNIKPGNTEHKMKNLNFDVIDGLYDDYLRKFARDAKNFGHPFIFRLNNEMNSTWVRYSGIALMCDPDVYIKVWRHIYDIFEEEGVDNAIWVFNPNDVDYPPLKWNSHISYYPGNKYVHMIGLTGYNSGTYYRDVTGERWRSFTEIYDPLNEKYSRLYGQFPWMITEFACSSVGGDKEKWIRDMFSNIGKYKNIKAAVWWSYADFDYNKSKKGIPARRYWLDEKPEYLKAFREGLRQ